MQIEMRKSLLIGNKMDEIASPERFGIVPKRFGIVHDLVIQEDVQHDVIALIDVSGEIKSFHIYADSSTNSALEKDDLVMFRIDENGFAFNVVVVGKVELEE